MSSNKSRYIKKDVLYELLKEPLQCSNYPGSNKVKNYNCPMWLLYNGSFDDSGYEVDHIEEFSKTHNNNLSNLQLLCACCHKVKTKIFIKNKCIFTSTELDGGECLMDIEKDSGKKRKIEK